VEPLPAEVPALEPHETPQQHTEERSRILATQQDIRVRMGRIDRSRLSALEHKTLEDAGTFLVQSQRALESGDLLRAFNLARKASLLVSALE
jgi:hypothetical protein